MADRWARAATALRPGLAGTRSRIIEAAARLFLQFGHRKTTIGDITRVLSISPANIYRFFPSKKAINEAVCRRLLGDLIPPSSRGVTPPPRLLVELARLNAERSRGDKPLHQLLAVAT